MRSELERTWEIHPLQGIGDLRFGKSRSDVRRVLGDPSQVVKKAPFAVTETDVYNDLGLQLEFDSSGRLESVNAGVASKVTFDGLKLIDVGIEEVERELNKRGFNHHEYIFEEAGISLVEIDGVVKGVTIFPLGYNDLSNPDSAASRAERAAQAWVQERLKGSK